jgi:cytochrome c
MSDFGRTIEQKMPPLRPDLTQTALLRAVAVALSFTLGSAAGKSADLSTGASLAEKWCSECHAVRAGGVGPNRSAPAFLELAAEPSITEYSLRALLRSPHATMPQLMLTPDETDDLVDYILSLKPGR